MDFSGSRCNTDYYGVTLETVVSWVEKALRHTASSPSLTGEFYCVPTSVLKLQRRKLFKFYWYIIDLQHCDNFCCTAKWFSYANIHISFPYSFLLRFITGYWLQFLVQYSRNLLFIHPIYDGYIFLHLLILNSQFIPPRQPLSLTEEEIES